MKNKINRLNGTLLLGFGALWLLAVWPLRATDPWNRASLVLAGIAFGLGIALLLPDWVAWQSTPVDKGPGDP